MRKLCRGSPVQRFSETHETATSEALRPAGRITPSSLQNATPPAPSNTSSANAARQPTQHPTLRKRHCRTTRLQANSPAARNLNQRGIAPSRTNHTQQPAERNTSCTTQHLNRTRIQSTRNERFARQDHNRFILSLGNSNLFCDRPSFPRS
jgi:hypothetical protein